MKGLRQSSGRAVCAAALLWLLLALGGASGNAQSPPPANYADLEKAIQERAARDVELGRPAQIENLETLFGSDAERLGISLAHVVEVYEKEYLRVKRATPWSKRLVTQLESNSTLLVLTALVLLLAGVARAWQKFSALERQAVSGKSLSESMESPSVDTKRDRASVVSIGKEARIETVRLRNIRGFEDLELSFMDSSEVPRPATLVIGKNGTNKTTLLRCIVLGLADNVDSSSLITKPIGALISEGAQYSEIEIDLRGDDGETYVIKKVVRRSSDGKEYVENDGPSYKLFVSAYGAGRAGVGVDVGREYRILDSVLNLFDYGEKLLDTELTLRRLKDTLGKRQYERTKDGLKRILNLSPEDDLRPGKGGGVEVFEESLGEWVRLESWADGYRLTLGWLLDLFGWAMRAGSVDADGMPRGIVLVDELDQHLHPSMQARVLRELKEILPGMQIIATTHSPLMALGAEPEELVALRRVGGRVEKVDPIPDFSFYSAEDMLTDKALFDTPPHAPEANELLDRYHRLAAIPPERVTGRQRRELKGLADQLAERQIVSRRDEAEDAEILKLLRQLEPSSTGSKTP